MRAIKCITIFLMIFALCTCCVPYVRKPVGETNKNSLWRVKNGENSIYLLGSVHVLKSENYPLDERIEKAYKDSQILVLEIDMDKIDDVEMAQIMMNRGILSGGVTFEEALSPETAELVAEKISELGYDIAFFQTFEPWLFALTLTMMRLEELGFDIQYGIDHYFFSKAKEMGKDIIGLETLSEQIDLLDTLTPDIQEELVLQTIEEIDIIESEVNSLVTAWSNGDSDTLEAILHKSFKDLPQLYESLVIKRNKNWIVKIESFFDTNENYLIIVGAGHLVGKGGIIDSLTEKGYVIEQL